VGCWLLAVHLYAKGVKFGIAFDAALDDDGATGQLALKQETDWIDEANQLSVILKVSSCGSLSLEGRDSVLVV
jgi:hypothetical protein